MRVQAWPLTNVGNVRSHNEDSFLIDDELGLYLVADGMGGHAGGAHASQCCVEVVASVVKRGLRGLGHLAEGQRTAAIHDLLAAAASEASASIFDEGQRNSMLHGMGTTLCGMLFYRSRCHIVHVGDSRCYLFRQGSSRQLTNDHSWLNEQVQAGLLTPEEAELSDLKHIITRSVGFERQVNADLISINVAPGDCLLVCSDGLSNYFEAQELGDLVRDHFCDEVPALVTDMALQRGGEDNITVIVASVGNGEDVRISSAAGEDVARGLSSDTLPPV